MLLTVPESLIEEELVKCVSAVGAGRSKISSSVVIGPVVVGARGAPEASKMGSVSTNGSSVYAGGECVRGCAPASQACSGRVGSAAAGVRALEGSDMAGAAGVPGEVRASCQTVPPEADVPLRPLRLESGRAPAPNAVSAGRTRPKLSMSGFER